MAVLVQQVQQAKSGKSLRIMLSDKWYGASLDSGLNVAQGKMIEAEIQTSEKYGPWINKWTYSVAAPQVPPPQSGGIPPTPQPAAAAPYDERNPPPQYAEPRKTGNGDNIAPWYWPSVSNICSSAMQAGLIKNPNDLNQWALKWAQVSVAVKEQVGT